jgi:hypothetical protein
MNAAISTESRTKHDDREKRYGKNIHLPHSLWPACERFGERFMFANGFSAEMPDKEA